MTKNMNLVQLGLSLTLDLADATSRVQDFVIVHELLHHRVRNHGRLFKVADECPRARLATD
ncbi:MAG: YgjP-like metallopeptidase domain-containing protein [Vicinamibacterales bacterium]